MKLEPQADPNAAASAAKIAALSTALIDAVNARDWDLSNGLAAGFVQHLAPGFRSWSDITSQQEEQLPLAGQIAVWKERGLQHPEARFEIIDTDTKLLDVNQASVFISMRVHGVDAVMLHAMNEFQWSRLGNGRWQCNRLLGLRGSFWSAGSI